MSQTCCKKTNQTLIKCKKIGNRIGFVKINKAVKVVNFLFKFPITKMCPKMCFRNNPNLWIWKKLPPKSNSPCL